MTPFSEVQAKTYDQDTLDDVDAVLRDAALNGHVRGVQAIRRALDAQRSLLALGVQFSYVVPAPAPAPARARPSLRRGQMAPPASSPERDCGHTDPLRGRCLRKVHPKSPRAHEYFAGEVTVSRPAPTNSSVPQVSFRPAS